MGSLMGIFGDAMNANALAKLKGPLSGGAKKKGADRKKGKKSSAKDKRFQMKQSQRRRKAANAAPASDQPTKSKLGRLVHGNNQKSKSSKEKAPEFKLPGQHQFRGEKLTTRQEFADDDEWTIPFMG